MEVSGYLSNWHWRFRLRIGDFAIFYSIYILFDLLNIFIIILTRAQASWPSNNNKWIWNWQLRHCLYLFNFYKSTAIGSSPEADIREIIYNFKTVMFSNYNSKSYWSCFIMRLLGLFYTIKVQPPKVRGCLNISMQVSRLLGLVRTRVGV